MRLWQSRWFRWLLSLFFLLILVAVWLRLPPSWPSAEPLPSVDTNFKRECEVVRDKFNVPHIKAAERESVFYCWGRVHAQDRGWQMDHLRRIAVGRVAEVHGMKYAQQDFMLRIINLISIAKRWSSYIRKSMPEKYRLFQFYIWGINDGLKRYNRRTPRHPVLQATGKDIAPWRLEDSMALFLLQGFQMTSMSFSNDIKHARYRLALGEKRYHQLYGPDMGKNPLDRPVIRSGEHPMVPHKQGPPPTRPALPTKPTPRRSTQRMRHHRQKLAALGQLLQGLPKFIPTEPGGFGSNGWLVAPTRSKSGYALLANDTHMPITTPNFWHEVHVQSTKFDSIGYAIPGLPSIVVGHNRNLAWGLTAGQSNSADTVKATDNGDGTVQVGKNKLLLHKFRPVVRVKVGPFHIPVFWKTFYRTKRGPILPIPWPGKTRLLVRWVPYSLAKPPLFLLDIIDQQTTSQADQLVKQMTFPNLNMLTADTQGNISYRQFGDVARRKAGIHGLLDPTKPSHRWNGFLKPHESPYLHRNKKTCSRQQKATSERQTTQAKIQRAVCRRSYVVSSNNRPFPASYPYFLGHAFDKGFRAGRIARMLEESTKHTLKDMMRIQTDVRVPLADLALPRLLQGLMAKEASLSALEKDALQRLKRWSRNARREQVGPTLFRVWVEHLRRLMFAKDAVSMGKRMAYPRRLAFLQGLHGKIPLRTQQPIDTLIHTAFTQMVQYLTRLYGKDRKQWTWGKHSRVYFRSLVGKGMPWSPGPRGKDGDLDTVNVSHHHRTPGPYRISYAASIRVVVEVGPRIRSYGVLAGSQDGRQPKKWSKEHKRWLNNKYRIRPYYPDEIKKYFLSKKKISY